MSVEDLVKRMLFWETFVHDVEVRAFCGSVFVFVFDNLLVKSIRLT